MKLQFKPPARRREAICRRGELARELRGSPTSFSYRVLGLGEWRMCASFLCGGQKILLESTAFPCAPCDDRSEARSGCWIHAFTGKARTPRRPGKPRHRGSKNFLTQSRPPVRYSPLFAEHDRASACRSSRRRGSDSVGNKDSNHISVIFLFYLSLCFLGFLIFCYKDRLLLEF